MMDLLPQIKSLSKQELKLRQMRNTFPLEDSRRTEISKICGSIQATIWILKTYDKVYNKSTD